MAIGAGLLAVSTALAPAQATSLVSLPQLFETPISGFGLKIVEKIRTTDAYTRYGITYRSGRLTISGIMNVPKGSGRFPVVVLAHGNIPLSEYSRGAGLAREQDYLARQGFIVLHTDYRNHARSSKDPDYLNNLRIGYVEDVIAAARAARASAWPQIDRYRISLLGRSMGGGIGYSALVIAPDLFRSAVLYAPMSAIAAESNARLLESNPDLRKRVYRAFGSPESNPQFWDELSPYNYFERVNDAVLIHQGTDDLICPKASTDTAVERLRELGKDVQYEIYPGNGHLFTDAAWQSSMQRSVEFLRAHLNDPVTAPTPTPEPVAAT